MNKVYRSVKYGMFVRDGIEKDKQWLALENYFRYKIQKGTVFRIDEHRENGYLFGFGVLPPIDGTLWIDIPKNVYKQLDKERREKNFISNVKYQAKLNGIKNLTIKV